MRCPRADLQSAPGRLGYQSPGIMTGSGGASLDWDRRRRVTPVQTTSQEAWPEAEPLGRNNSLRREPRWNADRRARPLGRAPRRSCGGWELRLSAFASLFLEGRKKQVVSGYSEADFLNSQLTWHVTPTGLCCEEPPTPFRPREAGEGDHWSSRSERTVVEGAAGRGASFSLLGEFLCKKKQSEYVRTSLRLFAGVEFCAPLHHPASQGGPPPPLSRWPDEAHPLRGGGDLTTPQPAAKNGATWPDRKNHDVERKTRRLRRSARLVAGARCAPASCRRIDAEVDWNIELGTVARLAQGPGTGPALLFNKSATMARTPAAGRCLPARCRAIAASP